MDIMQTLNQRLGYKESLIISRDEFNAIEEQVSITGAEYDALQKENCEAVEELEGVHKRFNLAVEIIEGIIECIDDEGVVTPGDKALLARRVTAAVKFIGNLND